MWFAATKLTEHTKWRKEISHRVTTSLVLKHIFQFGRVGVGGSWRQDTRDEHRWEQEIANDKYTVKQPTETERQRVTLFVNI